MEADSQKASIKMEAEFQKACVRDQQLVAAMTTKINESIEKQAALGQNGSMRVRLSLFVPKAVKKDGSMGPHEYGNPPHKDVINPADPCQCNILS